MPAIVDSQTPHNQKDEWRTPSELYKMLNYEFCFELDAAATYDNTLCERHYTMEDDALIQNWGENGVKRVFCNPPFSRMKEFLEKAIQEYEDHAHEIEIVVLIRADGYETKWFQQVLDPRKRFTRPILTPRYHIRQLIPRVSFNLPSGSKPSAGPTFPSAVVVLSKHYPPGMYWWHWKDEAVEKQIK